MANFVIDKSRFTDEQLAAYEELVAIGKAEVDPAANQEQTEGEEPTVPPAQKKTTEKAEVDNMTETQKSAPETAPELQAALDELASLRKSFEMNEMLEVAKKYAPALGKDEKKLAQTLYDMKKSNEANYNAYIDILAESAALVEKSGTFAEIGKSGHDGSGSALTGSEAKADAKAKEIMKADPNMSYTEAIAKAWEDPELMAECDAEYFGN